VHRVVAPDQSLSQPPAPLPVSQALSAAAVSEPVLAAPGVPGGLAPTGLLPTPRGTATSAERPWLAHAPVRVLVAAAVAVLAVGALLTGGLLSAVLVILAAVAAVQAQGLLALRRRTASLDELTRRDELTDLGNRRAFWQALPDQVSAAGSAGQMSLVMIDFDWFAAVNKRHGHQTGDAVLRRGAALVRDQVGSRGSCFRYGGEELAVLLPDHAEPEAARVAQEIRQAMSERDDDLPAVTVSCGVACTAPEVSPWDLVERADQALLLAKRCGRNQVMTVDALRDAAAGSAEAQDASVTAARRAALDLATVTLSVHAHATADHSEEVVVLCAALAGRLAIPGDERRVLLDAARLHDIGKIAVAPSILNKPGPLSEEEWKIMREHTPAGERILRSVPEMAEVAVVVRHAHEHFDGTGYPDGLAGEAIPLASRIILCADAFHAIREDRPYRHGASAVAAMTEIQAHAGTQFDPRVVEALGHIQSEVGVSPTQHRGLGSTRGASPRLLALLLTFMLGATAVADPGHLRRQVEVALRLRPPSAPHHTVRPSRGASSDAQGAPSAPGAPGQATATNCVSLAGTARACPAGPALGLPLNASSPRPAAPGSGASATPRLSPGRSPSSSSGALILPSSAGQARTPSTGTAPTPSRPSPSSTPGGRTGSSDPSPTRRPPPAQSGGDSTSAPGAGSPSDGGSGSSGAPASDPGPSSGGGPVNGLPPTPAVPSLPVAPLPSVPGGLPRAPSLPSPGPPGG